LPGDLSPPERPWVSRPKPRIISISVAKDGNLWVLIRRATRSWRKEHAVPNGPIKPRILDSEMVSRLFEGVVEKLDARTGKRLASVEVPGTVRGLLEGDRAYSVTEDRDGRREITVWQLSVP